MSFRRVVPILFFLAAVALLLGTSSVPPGDQTEHVRAFTRSIEFDYVAWTLDAIQTKLDQVALGTSAYLSQARQHNEVIDYLHLVVQIQQEEALLAEFYASPDILNPQEATLPLRQKLEALYAQRAHLGPLAEAILQQQVSDTAAEMGLALAGETLPPVLFHSTPLPLALIVSPRNVIRQDEDISINPGMTLDQQVSLEGQVDKALNVSSLVVPIGGIGVYPTMVMQTDDLNWLAEVVSHEWTHNYLTLRPLGINYETSPELRTMNETTASISGKEIGRRLIERFYPELLPPPPPETPSTTTPQPAAPSPTPTPAGPPPFDFRAEMRTTRVTVDDLLAKGKIEEAEAYMEQRRQLFWNNGYQIRKINQAYFAFYGAYADQPGGAAGTDPVGAAVRELRLRSASLADFIKRMSWMSSYDQLKRAVGQP
jgi:hypothetical protein